MRNSAKHIILLVMLVLVSCQMDQDHERRPFEPTEDSSKPWVYWYWMRGAYSKEGITADLEAMKQAGIRGAYLMTIKGPDKEPLINPPINQLSKAFWQMIHWALTEADRLGLKIAFHPADGFAVAGGPWITPELSMQKVIWSDTTVLAKDLKGLALALPPTYKGYFKDIATFAIPVEKRHKTSQEISPKILVSNGEQATYLSDYSTDQKQLRLAEPGYIQYQFDTPFACKSIHIETKGNNYQAHRLEIEISDDGKQFTSLGRLETPRSGWQDTDAFYTHSFSATAKYFRFVYNPEGSEPGAEDLDMAKWNAPLKLTKIILSEEPRLENYQGKSGAVWRLSSRMSNQQIPNSDCVEPNQMINVSGFVDARGILDWERPNGTWRILRFGHTSTGHENATGGGGRGLEVDKFNPKAIRFQLDQWFGELLRTAGPELASSVLEILHLDSWECGSQNWSPVFREAFKLRRGYDIVEFLPVMAGIPIESAAKTEQILYDVRKTIAELIADNFFGTLQKIATKNGIHFSAENVAPTMTSDALLHFKYVDYPSGEFWLRSPTHDKPNDMLDAISAGHIYGKDIIQAEAFTQLRMDWDEHPGNLKTLADRNYALGINRFFYHVFVHNPWLDRKPGMTLDPIGTFFQRDQTWWKPGKAFFEYCQRIQHQLQKGNPVIDLAVFTGEDIPSRAVLPDRLVPFIPNVFGKNRVLSEKQRLENIGQPIARMPKEVRYSKNSTDLSQWTNALNGYKYTSFNSDVLLNDAQVRNGKVVFQGEIEYQALLFPGQRKMNPSHLISLEVAQKMLLLVKEGATIMIAEKPKSPTGLTSAAEKEKWHKVVDELWDANGILGKGKVIKLPYLAPNFDSIGCSPDLIIHEMPQSMAWTHRRSANSEIYFLSNQLDRSVTRTLSFRVSGRVPYLYDPVSGIESKIHNWKLNNNRTEMVLPFAQNESFFVIFRESTIKTSLGEKSNIKKWNIVQELNGNWTLQFDKANHGPSMPMKTNKMFDWSRSENDSIKYYSGTTLYVNTFDWERSVTHNLWLAFEDLNNIAEVTLNGINCGVIWTHPYQINISEALKKGKNTLEIKVTNTWSNRLIGDQKLAEKDRLTWTTAPFRLEGNALHKSGLLGSITIQEELNEYHHER